MNDIDNRYDQVNDKAKDNIFQIIIGGILTVVEFIFEIIT